MKTDAEMVDYFDNWKKGKLDIEGFLQIFIEQEESFLAQCPYAENKQLHEEFLQSAQKRLRDVRKMRAKLKYLEELK